jgi:hypothetical protein
VSPRLGSYHIQSFAKGGFSSVSVLCRIESTRRNPPLSADGCPRKTTGPSHEPAGRARMPGERQCFTGPALSTERDRPLREDDLVSRALTDEYVFSAVSLGKALRA